MERIQRINECATKQYWDIIEHCLNCMCIAANLACIWRFPYVLYVNNGGSFLYQYCLLMALVGFPMTVLNFGVGQFSGQATASLWGNLAVAWKGIGVTQFVTAIICLLYYGFHAALILRYACNSWTSKFAWGQCESLRAPQKLHCMPIYPSSQVNKSMQAVRNTSSAELYLGLNLLQSKIKHQDISFGGPNFEICFYLSLVWLLNYMYTSIGVSKYSKLAVITGTLPYIMLIIFTMRVVMLPGASQGLLVLFIPTFETFISIDSWLAALVQCFASLSVSCGAITVLAPSTNFNHKITRTVIIILTWNLIISLCAAISMFSVLGFLANILDVQIQNTIKVLDFWSPYIAYSIGLIFMQPATSVYAFLFFCSLYLCILYEMSSYSQIISLNLIKKFQRCGGVSILMILMIICFLTTIIFTTPEGTFIAHYFDICGNGLSRAILVPAQIIAVIFTYGLRNWCWDYEFMLKSPPNIYYRWSWAVIIPFILIIIYLPAGIFSSTNINIFFAKPTKIVVTCLCVLALLCLPLPLIMLYQFFYNCDNGCKLSISRIFNHDLWWPDDSEHSDPMLRYRGEKIKEAIDNKGKPGMKYKAGIGPLCYRMS